MSENKRKKCSFCGKMSYLYELPTFFLMRWYNTSDRILGEGTFGIIKAGHFKTMSLDGAIKIGKN